MTIFLVSISAAQAKKTKKKKLPLFDWQIAALKAAGTYEEEQVSQNSTYSAFRFYYNIINC